MKTKTNSIFAIILMLLLGLFADASQCSCPSDFSQKLSTTIPTIVTVLAEASTTLGDICEDCGHTKSCCYSHQEQPAVGLAITVVIPDLESGTHFNDTEVFSLSKKDAMGGVGNKAPPWVLRPTLHSLNRKLLV